MFVARLLLLASNSQPLSERTVHDGICELHASHVCLPIRNFNKKYLESNWVSLQIRSQKLVTRADTVQQWGLPDLAIDILLLQPIMKDLRKGLVSANET